MRNKFLLKQSEATTTTTKKRAFTRSHTNNMVNMSERTNVTHKPCNACIKSRRNYFFIIMFEFDTRHIVCAVWCVFVVLKLVNALFLWKLVRALKLKELLFCVDKFKYKTNYRCTLNDDPSHGLASKQDKSRGRTKQKRKEKKVEWKTENRLNGEWKHSRNIIIINSMVHTTLNPSSSEVLSFFKILSYCVQTFPIPSHTEQYIHKGFADRTLSKWRLMRLFLHWEWESECQRSDKSCCCYPKIPYGTLLLYIGTWEWGRGASCALHGTI